MAVKVGVVGLSFGRIHVESLAQMYDMIHENHEALMSAGDYMSENMVMRQSSERSRGTVELLFIGLSLLVLLLLVVIRKVKR